VKAFQMGVQVGTPRRQPYGQHAHALQRRPKTGAEHAVPICEHVSQPLQKTVRAIGQVPGDLLRPGIRGIGCAVSEVHAPSGYVHHEEGVVRQVHALFNRKLAAEFKRWENIQWKPTYP
jgi:hypothetical protein